MSERFRIVLVEPQYEANVGAVARAMANFGFSDLAIVSPKCNPRGFEALKYAKHARDLLDCAKICRSLAQATSGCKATVGTTGVLYRHYNKTFRNPIPLRQLRTKVLREADGRVALVFGNEGTGLSERHISRCDFLLTIPTSEGYPVLNLSHAVAICLYELSGINQQYYPPAGKKEKEELIKAFSRITGRYSKIMRNPQKAKVAFRRMVGRAMLSDKECAAVLGVVRRALRELEEKRGGKG